MNNMGCGIQIQYGIVCLYVHMCMYVGILLSAKGADQGNFNMFFAQGTKIPKSF